MINAGCDPGPVHIHGLTTERLAGAPRFADVLPDLLDVLHGRVLVAHNAVARQAITAAGLSHLTFALVDRQRFAIDDRDLIAEGRSDLAVQKGPKRAA